MSSRFFVTGTDTGIGKTVVSALLCAALDAFYWKPIQTGTREGTDRETVMALAGIPAVRTIPEIYKFAPPVSPHLAARMAGAKIDLRKIHQPRLSKNTNLIAEGAGGVLVPINDRQLMSDLMKHLKWPVVLVSRTALGTINHTLLSLAALRAKKLRIAGVVMVGKANVENRRAVEKYGDISVIGFVPPLAELNRAVLLKVFRKNFNREAFGA